MQGVRVHTPWGLSKKTRKSDCIAVVSMSICFVFSFSFWFTVADPRSPSPFTLKLKQPTGQNSRDGHGKSRVFCWGYPPLKTPARTKKVLCKSKNIREQPKPKGGTFAKGLQSNTIQHPKKGKTEHIGHPKKEIRGLFLCLSIKIHQPEGMN